MQTSDFYLVLPSNASPDTHPTNNATQFTVRLGDTIYLDNASNWKVALIEMGYSYHPPTLSPNFSIKYKHYREETDRVRTWVELIGKSDTQLTIKLPKYLFPYKDIVKTYVEADRLYFESKEPFRLNIPNGRVHSNETQQSNFDESRKVHVLKVNQTVPQLFANSLHGTNRGRKVPIHFTFFNFHEEEDIIQFPHEVTLGSAKDLVAYMIHTCGGKVFNNIHLDKNGILCFQLADRVTDVEFQGGLNFVLGFVESQFHVQNKERLQRLKLISGDNQPFYASLPPNLTRGGMQNMFIKADICKPVIVGSERLPLLRNVIVDTSQDFNMYGALRKYESCPLIYVDVSTSFISQITFEIKSEKGHPIIFPNGSVTILTLHFKKL